MTEAEMQRQEAVVEAVLFTMGKSVETSLLAAALECTAAEAEAAAERLAARYAEANRGVQLLRLENAWQLGTKRELNYRFGTEEGKLGEDSEDGD